MTNDSPKFPISLLLFLCLFDLLMVSCGSVHPIDSSSCKGSQARPVNDFLNSLGVNSAISTRGESLQKTIAIAKYLGIRWIRSGYEGNLPTANLIKLHRQTGLRFSYGLLSGGNDIDRLLTNARQLAIEGALLAIEGANEPNNWQVKQIM